MRTRYLIAIVPLFVTGLLIGANGIARLNTTPATISIASNIAAQAATPTIALIPPTSPAPSNSTIDVQVTTTNASNITAFEFDLYYDRDRLRLVDVTFSSFLGQTSNCNADTTRCSVKLGPLAQNEITSIGAYSYGAGAGATGNGILAVLHFQPIGSAGTAALTLSNALLTDSGANAVTPITQNANLVIPTRVFLPFIRK